MLNNVKKPALKINWYIVLLAVIILAAVLTRFVNLGERVMSHDEVNHVVPSYDYYTGAGYRHDPISHGPFQFHLITLSYFLFGDNDFTSRLPHALASVATIIFLLLAFRKYYGKSGATIAGFLFLISPFLMFYGRYARNEALIGLFLVIIIYTWMRHYQKHDNASLFILTAILSIYFTTKETAYIHTALMMIFLFIKMLAEIVQAKLITSRQFLINILVILLIIISLGGSVLLFRNSDLSAIENAAVVLQTSTTQTFQMQVYFLWESIIALIPGLIPLLIGLAVIFSLRKYLGWVKLAASPAFNLFVLIVTLILPLLAAFPVRLTGFDPIDYSNTTSNILNVVYILYLAFVGIILGSTWKKDMWWKFAILFYSIFFVFYTSFFTNMIGSLTGIVGSLGYWLAQQDVNRGNQPIYYYALLQMPFYEFLALLGSLVTVWLTFFRRSRKSKVAENKTDDLASANAESYNPPIEHVLSTPILLLFWGIASLIAFTIAGEKMPWLTVHIAIPFLLLAAYGLGKLVDSIDWKKNSIFTNGIAIFFPCLIIFLAARILLSLLGNEVPFGGNTQAQLRVTYQFIFNVILLAGTIVAYKALAKKLIIKSIGRSFVLGSFILLAILTTQSALRASFINYDNPMEYLVYAHAARGPKDILEQVEEISNRTTGNKDIKVAYDNHSLYPFWWYFRDYPNRIAYMENPTRSLQDAPIILAGSANYSSVEPIIRNNYYTFEYFRLWWPNQNYFNLDLRRIAQDLRSPDMRQALLDIWLQRDYSLYAIAKNNSFVNLSSWSPSEKMRMYIRKDIADQMWDYVSEEKLTQSPSISTEMDQITSTIYPEQFLGGNEVLNQPRGIAIASDGTIFVADSKNNQIKHFSTNGLLINAWGAESTTAAGSAGGTFLEPWDVAVSPDGLVYVTDTWNHRIQKFSFDGDFISMWGTFAQGFTEDGYWGPRSISVDGDGNVYFSDTGNKRIMIFDKDDEYLTQFGSAGFGPGQFDEPVGIALAENGDVYVADTWNRRIQVISPNLELDTSTPLLNWDVDGWYGQSMENKPFIAIGPEGNIFITDPEGALILKYAPDGEILHIYDVRGLQDEVITMPVDLAFDQDGLLWVSDATSNMVYAYRLE